MTLTPSSKVLGTGITTTQSILKQHNPEKFSGPLELDSQFVFQEENFYFKLDFYRLKLPQAAIVYWSSVDSEEAFGLDYVSIAIPKSQLVIQRPWLFSDRKIPDVYPCERQYAKHFKLYSSEYELRGDWFGQVGGSTARITIYCCLSHTLMIYESDIMRDGSLLPAGGICDLLIGSLLPVDFKLELSE